jgi:hypothetical protein
MSARRGLAEQVRARDAAAGPVCDAGDDTA